LQPGVLVAQRDGLSGLVPKGRADIGKAAGRDFLLSLNQLALQLHDRSARA
jgi:hypothetical protein